MKNEKIKIVAIVLTLSMLLALPFVMVGCGDKNPITKTTFYIAGGMTVWNLPFGLILVPDDSTIVLRSDGTMTMKITLNAKVLNGLLAGLFPPTKPDPVDTDGEKKDPEIVETENENTEAGQTEPTAKKVASGLDLGIDISGMLGDLNLLNIVDIYAGTMFPGFSLDDLVGSLAMIEKSLGVSISGLDFNEPVLANILKTIKETGSIGSIEGFQLSKNISIIFNGIYKTENYHSETSGDYKMVLCGFGEITSDPFLIMNIGEDIFGNETISCYVEFIKLAIKGSVITPDKQ